MLRISYTYELILVEVEAGLFRLVPVVVLGDRVQPGGALDNSKIGVEDRS